MISNERVFRYPPCCKAYNEPIDSFLYCSTDNFDFDFYDVNIFNRCENGNDILMAIPGWANVHPLLKVIPVEWEHYIPYGLLHSPQPSKTVVRFLAAAKAAASK